MEVTKEKMEELLAGIKKVAMDNRERAGFRGNFTPVAIIVGPDGEHTVQGLPYRTRREKEMLMKAISETARLMNVIAIVLVNDTYHVDRGLFTKFFNLAPDLTDAEYEKIYYEILDDEFGGTLANAPKEIVSDALLVAMKGPHFKQRIFFMPYHEGVGDSIRWDKEQPEHDGEILVLEDWWDTETVH